MVIYGAETWTMTEKDMNYLMIITRRILKKISGLVQGRNGWRIRTNLELNKLIGWNNREVHKDSKIEMVGPFT